MTTRDPADTPARASPTCRPATNDDRALCWRLHQLLRPYVEATWGWDTTDQRRRFDAWFDAAPLQIIEHDARAVGMLRVDHGDVPVRLLSIVIAAAEQRRGIGAAVIADVVREAAHRPVWLQVLKANPARALYARLGFTVIGESDTHWHMLRAADG